MGEKQGSMHSFVFVSEYLEDFVISLNGIVQLLKERFNVLLKQLYIYIYVCVCVSDSISFDFSIACDT